MDIRGEWLIDVSPHYYDLSNFPPVSGANALGSGFKGGSRREGSEGAMVAGKRPPAHAASAGACLSKLYAKAYQPPNRPTHRLRTEPALLPPPQGEARRALERMYNKQERDKQVSGRGGSGVRR